MSQSSLSLDLRRSCDVYTQSVRDTMARLLNIDVAAGGEIESTKEFELGEDLYFSILFTGRIYGEFVIGVNRMTAANMLGLPAGEALEGERREELIDAFKELINIAAGATLTEMRKAFPDLSITPPRSIEGRITLGNLSLQKTRLSNASGNLSCYIYVDFMKLQVAEALQAGETEREELNRLNRAKSEFLSNMSHELRTPLNGMIGMLDLLRTSDMTPAQSEQLNVICKSGDFLLSIINDILEISKIESGKLQIEEREFSLSDCLEGVAETMAASVFAKNLDFDVFISPLLRGTYRGDETRIKQVLVNLIGNAIKFTPTGAVRLEAYPREAGGVSLSVSDTGIGIPAAKLDRIFESFSQADVSDNRRYGGSGLGLTISKSIVSAMGGEIRVESQEASGSTFRVNLPLEKIALSAEQGHQPRRISVLAGAQTLKHVREYLPKCTVKGWEAGPADAETALLDYRLWTELTDGEREKFAAEIRAKEIYPLFLARPQDVSHIASLTVFGKACGYLTLPIKWERIRDRLVHEPAAQPERKACKIAEVRAEGAGRKLLLVEDNEINRTVANMMLTKMGYQVESAVHGKDALEKLEKGGFDLVLMDCQMPIMNGYEATIEIRKREGEGAPRLPVIAMTANAFRETKERCFECGMDDFVTKPIKMEALQDVIRRRLKKTAQ